MRLLNTQTLQFAEFFEADLPPYAILSHRWGRDEVSFREFRKGLLKEGKGYEKIVKCCEIAATQRLEWAWVDTCCIDKRSSAELSEAINSMFQWYANAEVCFVFLADVRPITILPVMTDEFTASPAAVPFDEREFHASSWFLRGWTLQELLAPVRLMFFNSAYQAIGRKARFLSRNEELDFYRGTYYPSLNSLICDATGIPDQYIGCETRKIHTASVGERLRWICQRQTTRVEDIAYCLLGIFDVNMPLLYGEGKKAFTRLQVEIMRRDTDESLFAWNIAAVELRRIRRQNITDIGDLLALEPHRCQFLADTGEVGTFSNSLRQAMSVTSKGVSLKTAVLNGVPILYVLNISWRRSPRGQFRRMPPVAVLLREHDGAWRKVEPRLYFGQHLLIESGMQAREGRSVNRVRYELGEIFSIPCYFCRPEVFSEDDIWNNEGDWHYADVLSKPDHLVHFPDDIFKYIAGQQVVVCQPNDVCTYIKRAGCQEWDQRAIGRKISDRTVILDRSLRRRIYIRQNNRW